MNNMDNSIILGGTLVPNPNYRKGNGQPEYIRSVNTNYSPSTIDKSMQQAAADTYVIRNPLASKLLDYNIVPTEKIDKSNSYTNILADAQSNWSKAVNALGQTLVSEIGIGIVKGASDLADAIGQNIIGISDHNYSNPVSQYLEEKQKEFEEWAPVYVDPDNNTLYSQFHGGFNLGYWFSNLPSIASSLTLLVPSMGIAKALSWAGKASKISKFTNRAARAIVNPAMRAIGGTGFSSAEMGVAFENGMSAALSRTMENYQEARQTYNDNYIDMSKALNEMDDAEYNSFLQRNAQYLKDNNVDTTNKDEVAKQLARSAADRTFQLDYANIVFDIYQIYGLRNLLSHAPKFNQSAATRAAQRNVIRTAGMTEEQAAKELAKDGTLTKAGHWIGDRFIGYGRQIKSELTEGIEEAVNYIAQQEGTHLGKYLLTGEGGSVDDLNLLSSIGPMTSRILNDYYNDTGLWDSAFWGVVGGVVFQAGGSKLNQISQTIKNRQAAKKSANKDNDTTKEAKLTPHWWALDQTAETERMLTEINGRPQKLNTFREQMHKINKEGKNPYIVDKDKKNPDISSPLEGRMLREKAYLEYLDEMIVTARNNGTLDMLSAYLEDSNVRQAIVAAYQNGDEEHKISKEEAEEAANKAVERVKKIDNLYKNEILHASDIADRVGDKEGTSLPAEYIQMIASANVRHKLNLERYDELAAMYKDDTQRIINTLGDKFDSTMNYQDLVNLRVTIQELSNLIAEKKELEAKQKEKPTITRQFDIDEINNQINLIKRKALNTSTSANFAKTIYALQVANSAVREYSPDGKDFKVNASDTDLIANLDEFLLKDLSGIFDEVGQERRTDISNDAVVGELKKVMHDMRYILPVDSNGKRQEENSYLENLDPKLPENYDILARIELEKIKETSKIAETEDEIRHYIGAINNVQNVARKAAIDEAYNTIFDLQKSHVDLDIMNIANRIYDENSSDWLVDTNGLSDKERNSLREALKVLNLADVKNSELSLRLAKTLVHARATQKQVDANNKQNTEYAPAETQTSSTSQEAISAQGNGQPINQSAEGENASTAQGNGQISENQKSNVPQQIELSLNGNTINYTIPKDDNASSKGIVPVKNLGNGNYELDFVSKGDDVKAEDVSNAKLFDIRQQPMDGGVVKRNPIVRFRDNNEVQVISEGLIENPSISSTGGLEQSSTVTAGNANAGDNSGDNNAKTVPQIPEAPVRGADPAEYIPKIAGTAHAAAIKLKEGETITYEEYLASLADVRAAINDDTTFEKLAKVHWNNNMQRLAKKYPEVVDKVIESLQSSTTENVGDTKFKQVFDKTFTDAVENLVKAYLKDIGQKKVNGKYIISLENLLRFCNGEFQNNENAELLYNVLANYLKSKDANNLYTVIESVEEISSPTFLDDVKTPLEERINKSIRQENHRINTSDVVDKTVFDEIEEGQELTMTQDRSKSRINFNFNGKSVGYIGIPNLVNGTYESPYKNFLFRIRPDGKDKYYSKLAEVFKAIVNANTGDLKEIRDAALDKTISLKDNKTWASIKNDYGVNTIDPETEEEYDNVDSNMLSVVRTMVNFAIKYGSADIAIDGWFNALAQEYIAADYLAKNKDTKVSIDNISDGYLIQAVDKVTDVNRRLIPEQVDKLPLASKAIGKNSKGRVSIAVGSRDAGVVECVVKKENDKVIVPAAYSFPGVRYSSTFVGIPISKGRVLFAQAYPITARYLTPNTPAAEIVTEFTNQITNYLKAIANNPRDTKLFEDLQNFLFEAFNYNNATTPLFHMDNCEKVGNGSSLGTHIGTNGLRGPRMDLKIFNNYDGRHIIQFEDSRVKGADNKTIKNKIAITNDNIDKITKELRHWLADTLQFNISANYINSDNNKRNQVTGFATRDADGKFVVKLGDKTWTFDSYNDFILDNDLVKVNTKPNEHGNNVTRSSSNPNIRYKIGISTPVEENVASSSMPLSSNEILNQANAIMSSSRTDKAAALARLILDGDTVTTLSIYDLLPHNLVYDKDFNTGADRENINASFNKKTKVTTTGPRFLSMLSNQNVAYRKQAIRKLIHERLHDILHSNGNEHYINDIKSIYDTFAKSLDNAEVTKPILEKYIKKNNLNISLDDYYENFKKYKYLSKQTEEERLEEFLVDTLTSVELANFLNNLKSLSKVNMRERKRDTLLNKIMRLLAKIMGIRIKNDSLYAQEFEALRKAIDSTAEQTLRFEENENKDNKETKQKVEPVNEPENNTKVNNQLKLKEENDEDELGSSTTEEYQGQTDYSQEMTDIKTKAIANGTFMKAPNGRPTNLTERQWLQVRTKAFKKWFGDWINDPANASKVVDENGEPRIVYRGINDSNNNKRFVYFSDSRVDAEAYAKGLLTKGGNFFANNKDIVFAVNRLLAEKYNLPYADLDYVDSILYDYAHEGEEYEVNDYEEYEEENEFLPFAETKRRLIGTHKEIYKSRFSKEEIQAAKKTIDLIENNKEVKELLEIIRLIDNTTFTSENDLTRQYDDSYYLEDTKRLSLLLDKYNKDLSKYKKEYTYNIQAVFLNIKNPYKEEIHSEDLLDNYKAYKNGHDGAFLLDGEHFLVKQGSQIKSATDNIGTFSTDNNDIRYSSTTEEYETVASIGDYIWSYSPEDRVEIAREINNGEISIKCK